MDTIRSNCAVREESIKHIRKMIKEYTDSRNIHKNSAICPTDWSVPVEGYIRDAIHHMSIFPVHMANDYVEVIDIFSKNIARIRNPKGSAFQGSTQLSLY